MSENNGNENSNRSIDLNGLSIPLNQIEDDFSEHHLRVLNEHRLREVTIRILGRPNVGRSAEQEGNDMTENTAASMRLTSPVRQHRQEMEASARRMALPFLLMLLTESTERNENVKCPVCNAIHEKEEASSNDENSACSHGARLLFASADCPICMEERMEPPLVFLRCGHVVCVDDFKRLGGQVASHDD